MKLGSLLASKICEERKEELISKLNGIEFSVAKANWPWVKSTDFEIFGSGKLTGHGETNGLVKFFARKEILDSLGLVDHWGNRWILGGLGGPQQLGASWPVGKHRTFIKMMPFCWEAGPSLQSRQSQRPKERNPYKANTGGQLPWKKIVVQWYLLLVWQ